MIHSFKDYIPFMQLPWRLSGKESACQHRRHGFDPWVRRRNGNLFQYSCLGNPMDRGTWPAIVHVVTKSEAQLSNQTTSPFTVVAKLVIVPML